MLYKITYTTDANKNEQNYFCQSDNIVEAINNLLCDLEKSEKILSYILATTILHDDILHENNKLGQIK